MSMHDALFESGIWKGQDANGLQNLCTELTFTGRLYQERIAGAIDEVAPKPDLLVYVSARKLAIPSNGLDPVLFSAIDATTHLQVAQAYLLLTTAAALSFVEFVARSFPFSISQIRTPAQRPFEHSTSPLSSRDFLELISGQGYVHSLINNPSRDAPFSITSRLLFGGIAEGSLVYVSPQELQRELGQFLFFHNNYRTIPWLEGKTPVQKLRMFGEFSRVQTFSPHKECDGEPPAWEDELLHEGKGRTVTHHGLRT
ncbi:MAG: hypothetical protein Q8P51_17600 [Ignavibacteria bacterium]|nr:hypothetical protein [Ignavibacteria bacterium]